MSNIEVKDYNVLIYLQPFYDIHDNYTTENSLTSENFSNYYKLTAVDLSKQNFDFKNQQINFVGKLEKKCNNILYY